MIGSDFGLIDRMNTYPPAPLHKSKLISGTGAEFWNPPNRNQKCIHPYYSPIFDARKKKKMAIRKAAEKLKLELRVMG